MNKLLTLALLTLGFASCSKDSLEPVSENFSIEKSELFVTVTYITWSDLACDLTCSGAGSQYINPMPNAKVELYIMGSEGMDDALADAYGLTQIDGTILFRDLEPGQYTVVVDSPLGQKSRVLYTREHRRSAIDFSF